MCDCKKHRKHEKRDKCHCKREKKCKCQKKEHKKCKAVVYIVKYNRC